MPDKSVGTRGDTFTTRQILECEKSDAFGFVKIVHANANDKTDTGTIFLPHEKNPKQTKFPNIKKRYPILKDRPIISIEATGVCFCWEVYGSLHYGGEKEVIYPGDPHITEMNPASLKKVSCPPSDDEDYDYDVASIRQFNFKID